MKRHFARGARVPVKLALLLFTLPCLWLAYLPSVERAHVLGLASGPAPLLSSAAALAARAVAGRGSGGGGGVSMVWVLLGSTHYQHYLLDSIRQARMWNPGVPFFLLSDALPQLHRERPAWASLLAQPHFNATLVDVNALRDARLHNIEVRFAAIWRILGGAVRMMQPTLSESTNVDFTNATLLRLVHLHNFMRSTQLRDVVHLENDQMVYGSAAELVVAARACGKDLVVAYLGPDRLAASVVYVSSAARGLESLMEFFLIAVSHGHMHAVEAAGNQYVTDMTLLAKFRWASLDAGLTNFTVWPTWHDGSCLSRELGGMTVDGAILGSWCCGDFIWPLARFEIKLEELADRAVQLWDWPFVWVLRPPPAGVPVQLVAGHAGAMHWASGGLGGSGRDPRVEWSGLADGVRWSIVSGGFLEEEGPAANGTAAVAPPRLRAAGPQDLLRVPLWNGTRVWNLHMHAKQLHLWRSDEDSAPPLNLEHPMGGRGPWWRELG